MAYKGLYCPKNPEKYKGDPNNIKYLSLWERNIMKTFDESKMILSWFAPSGSFEFFIPYTSPKDGKIHRYLPDFLAKVKQKDGSIAKFLIEVKPKIQTEPPKLPKSKRKSKRYFAALHTYAINQAKWAAARDWCEQNGYIFQVMTEIICT